MILTGCGTLASKSPVEGMVLVPAGNFTMGSNKEDNLNMWREANALNPYGFNDQLYVNEHPAHTLTLPAFLIDQYEVSNAQYRDFSIAAKHSAPSAWQKNGYLYSIDVLRSATLDELREVASNVFLLDMEVASMTREALLAEIEKIQAIRDSYPITMVTWSDANEYWQTKTMQERLAALELTRQVFNGYDPDTTRFQRILEVVVRP